MPRFSRLLSHQHTASKLPLVAIRRGKDVITLLARRSAFSGDSPKRHCNGDLGRSAEADLPHSGATVAQQPRPSPPSREGARLDIKAVITLLASHGVSWDT